MSKIDNFPYLTELTPIPAEIWGVSFGVDVWYWGPQRGKVRLIAVKFIPRISTYIYDHDTSTLQTDRRTYNLPWQYRALRSIARLNNLECRLEPWDYSFKLHLERRRPLHSHTHSLSHWTAWHQRCATVAPSTSWLLAMLEAVSVSALLCLISRYSL